MFYPMEMPGVSGDAGQDRIAHVTKVFFPLSQNHWDMFYRAIETSFVAGAAPAYHGGQ